MNVLLLGHNGQVGWELQRSLAPLAGPQGQLITLGREGGLHPNGDTLCGDLCELDRLAHTVRLLKPDIIVNAAAHTAVDKAESEPALARRLNTEAPALLAREAAALGAWLVHYSTDYVFDGGGSQPWLETDATAPLNVYGQTKRDGELAIAASGCNHLIFRTSWVYAARGGNFAKTMIRLAKERDRLTVINDQWGAPTGADLIADITAHAIRQATSPKPPQTLSGIYHLAAGGQTTWFDYANHVLAQYRKSSVAMLLRAATVTPVTSDAFATPARRPHNSRLCTAKLQSTFDLALPHWHQGVDRMLIETNP
jgi:dTDP-4-dehydrorhamnose reductase